MSYISLKNVSYQYPYSKQFALQDINLELKKGKFYGVIGQNGGGKTTLCNTIRGLIPHFYKGELSGEVLIDGTDVRNWNTGELSAKIGYVFQNPFTQISGIKETVFEEIAMGLENLGIEKNKIIESVISVSELLSISDLLEKNPNQLSGGQRQRVAFAAIIAMDAEMLVIDEPTSQLDPQGTEDVFAIIDKLKTSGKTIILVEHKVSLIARYCDQVIVMSDGKIALNGLAKAVLSDPRLEEFGATPPEVVHFGYAMQKAKKPLTEIPITVEEAVSLVEKRGKQS
ncbi:MAG: energy-coupling factor ABC transporter ATP-binding protein [Erysipelotrichaceae bacterium]|jgi:energy-coupling factor transport system ATP-binding protein|nr:energy-coupling factor ABC transporter ATP-binding protein [Erysipelotrichaceae bacterium]